jgi:Zn-dependent protease
MSTATSDASMSSTSSNRLSFLLQGRFRVCRIWGIPVTVHWSLFPILALATKILSRHYSSWGWSMWEILGVFSFIALHEFGHVIVMRRLKYDVREVVFWALGGAVISESFKSWNGEIMVASAGPAVNLTLAPITFLIWWLFGYSLGGDLSHLLWQFIWVNLFLGLLNLLPIWPLDGGRIFEASMALRFGVTRSRFLGGLVGVILAAIGSVWGLHLHDFLDVALFSVLIYLNARLLEWSADMSMIEKKWGFSNSAVCPKCGSRAIGVSYDFNSAVGDLRCHYCYQVSDSADWLVKTR